MAINIIDAIQMNLGYAQLHKIDPNSQDAKYLPDRSVIERLGQAAIPAVLAAIYKFSRTKNGAAQLLTGRDKQGWLPVIYEGRQREAVEKVAHFAVVTNSQAQSHMENIAEEAVKLIRESAGKPATPDMLRSYLNSQRHNILVYLPAALNMGEILRDEGLDDRTNKMEGPVSNLMHKVEDRLSEGGNK